jgi:multicomponent Na+:H+ antiporter subunit C
VTLLLALAVGALFGTGTYLLLKPDLFRVVVGLVLISNATILTLMASGRRGAAPIDVEGVRGAIADPLVQAMALTAVVIGFAVTAVLLALARRVHATHDDADLDALSRSEARAESEVTREEVEV